MRHGFDSMVSRLHVIGQIRAHYFEEGNVQLQTTRAFPSTPFGEGVSPSHITAMLRRCRGHREPVHESSRPQGLVDSDPRVCLWGWALALSPPSGDPRAALVMEPLEGISRGGVLVGLGCVVRRWGRTWPTLSGTASNHCRCVR
jgi:hypothetical protein